ncbi:MAG: formamidopyrimidine-DNA glycosylase, partial [Urechidicola sp.]
MPELPEVNTFQHYFNESALHQKIAQTIVTDDKIIRNC